MKCPDCKKKKRAYCFLDNFHPWKIPVIDAPEYEPITVKRIVRR